MRSGVSAASIPRRKRLPFFAMAASPAFAARYAVISARAAAGRLALFPEMVGKVAHQLLPGARRQHLRREGEMAGAAFPSAWRVLDRRHDRAPFGMHAGTEEADGEA
jgi:hypothetical protein